MDIPHEETIRFQSTPSAWRETKENPADDAGVKNFNPLPPHGGRLLCVPQLSRPFKFQSTPSAWRETERVRNTCNINLHFNPLPPHGGRRAGNDDSVKFLNISIHSLRMEGDSIKNLRNTCCEDFNPLPPHGGRQHRSFYRAATDIYFNPLPPHGGRRHSQTLPGKSLKFQSTPSAWRETESWGDGYDAASDISIHSLRMEGDSELSQP